MSTTDPRHRRITNAVAALAAVAVVGLTAACSGTGAAAPSAESPTAVPSPRADRCGGMTIDHSAAITASHEILVDAPLEDVWNTQTDVEGWGAWQDAVTSVDRLDTGVFDADSKFRWTTPVPASELSPADTLTITSTVQQLEPERCIIWEGPAIGEAVTIDKGTHLWSFIETDQGTLVHTEESWDAVALSGLEGADAQAAEEMLGGGLVVWLEQLKTEAEANA